MPHTTSASTFYEAVSTILGTTINDFIEFKHACHMHRLHGNWIDLIDEFARYTPRNVLDEVVKTAPLEKGNIVIHVLYRRATPLQYRARDVWKNVQFRSHFGGTVPILSSTRLKAFMCDAIDDHGAPARESLYALMRVCMIRGIDRGLRKAMAYLLHNLIVDNIIMFNLICGKNNDTLRENATHFLKERPTKRRVLENIDGIAREAAIEAVKMGYNNQGCARLLGMAHRNMNSHVRLWVVRRAVGKPVITMKEDMDPFCPYDDEFYRYLYQWDFPYLLDRGAFEIDPRFFCDNAVRLGFIHLLENQKTDEIQSMVSAVRPFFEHWKNLDSISAFSNYDQIMNHSNK